MKPRRSGKRARWNAEGQPKRVCAIYGRAAELPYMPLFCDLCCKQGWFGAVNLCTEKLKNISGFSEVGLSLT